MALQRRKTTFFIVLLVLQLFFLSADAAECSKTKLCEIGCCSKDGYCGTTSAHCGTGCLSTCDYKAPQTECSKTKKCRTGCCSKDGFCGTSSAHCGKGCLSTCDYKAPPTECSKTKKCATGCCSKDGFCGTTDKHCGEGCLSTCDFKLGCDKKNPCKDGSCCSKFGFCGFGPDFCSKDNCVTGCNAKTFCDPGGYGSQFANHTKCPLNVCCSKFGYCGLTEEFCGKKKVRRPNCSVSSSKPMKRVVGYYEGWAPARSCDRFTPSQIPDGVYTHINFAFATINPKTFEIAPAAKADPALYEKLVEKKHIDPNLKVFIAIGGWAFNDPGPTVTTFSDLARSQANQRKFISSVISFMNRYGFDGVDIDWEYPEAPDRQGRGEDFKNLPNFLANLKGAMQQSGSNNGLSIAIPASYWYLQHFDIKKIAKHVDFFNLMTYDFHGSWDTPQSWLGNHLNSHTNLTEIKDSLDLLWRNDIDPDQVNMGLAFYARTFTASNPSCLSPGCLFDAGGNKGYCTNAVGVLSNSEISSKLLSRQSSHVEFDKTAAVKIVTSGRQWLTYDDGDTWKLKLDFARSQCLGGAMVWAVSQDTRDGKYSKELQSATGYKSNQIVPLKKYIDNFSGLNVVHEDYEASTDITQEQCRWSNCGKGCPNNWKGVIRQDGDRHSSTERMLDDTGCGGRGSRTFCCPPGKQPHCEWQRFKRGKCSPGCNKDDQYEVGSTGIGCNNHKAQVACCSGDTPALDAYRQCAWHGKEPNCGTDYTASDCEWSNSLSKRLMLSMDGSGDQRCWQRALGGSVIGRLETSREYCCKKSSDDTPQWKNCDWYHKGLSSSATSRASECDATCPDGKVKLALQSRGCSSGKQAFCCDAEVTASTEYLVENFEAALKSWVKNPTCPNPKGQLSSRANAASSGSSAEDEGPSPVRRAYSLPSQRVVVQGLTEIISDGPTSQYSKKLRHVWDAVVVPIWHHLSAENLAAMWRNGGHGGYDFDSKQDIAIDTMCDMDGWEEVKQMKDNDAEEHKGVFLYCPMSILNTLDRQLLEDPEDVLVDEDDSLAGMLIDKLLGYDSLKWLRRIAARAGGSRGFPVQCPRGSGDFQLFSQSYPNGDNGDKLATLNQDQHRYYVDNNGGSCFSSDVDNDGKKSDGNWVSEHILELQTIARFAHFSMHGESKKPPKHEKGYNLQLRPQLNSAEPYQLATCTFWKHSFRQGFAAWNRRYAETPEEQLYTLLGSLKNADDMVNCDAKLNSMKARVWSLSNPVAKETWEENFAPLTKDAAQGAILELQLLQGVWQYLRSAEVKKKLLSVHESVAEFFVEFESLYREQYPSIPQMDLGSIQWREFLELHFRQMRRASSWWAEARLKELNASWTKHEAELYARKKNNLKVDAQLEVARQLLDQFQDALQQVRVEYVYEEDMFLNN